MGLDYEGLGLLALAVFGWSRAAQIDGRYILTRYAYLWGCGAGIWTYLCRSAMGHSPRQLIFDQVVVAVAMMVAMELHEKRQARG